MRLSLDIKKSLEENASHYFEQAKLSRKKAERTKAALEATKRKLATLEKEIEKKAAEEQLKKEIKVRKKEWYEKFRWFYTSEGFLVIGGRDATTNEVIIKKHADKEDIVFHTELSGSPFVVIKSSGGGTSEISLDETAQFTACYSKAWKAGRSVADVFHIAPEQVSKEAPAGEYIMKGAFMIYGKKAFITAQLRLFIGKMSDGKIMAGPESAVKKHCELYVEIQQGDDKTSSLAKKIKAKLNADDLDDIIKVLPQGSRLKE